MSLYIRSKKTGQYYVPHPGQQEVHECDKRFRIVIAGRKWGKTLCAILDLVKYMIENPGSLCFWVVPKYKQLLPVSRKIEEWIPEEIIEEKYLLQQTYRYIQINDSQCWFHSGDDPEGLRGPALDYVVLEEAAQLKAEVWRAVIRPNLLVSGGKALIISTPKGKNWLYEEYLKGISGEYEDYIAWRRPSYENPYIDKELIEADRRTLPEDIFRQEYLAEFIEASGTVFRGVRECFKEEPTEAEYIISRTSDGTRLMKREIDPEKYYYIGVDLGRHEDFTVFIALDDEGNLVGYDRFRRVEFPLQKTRLKEFLKHFPRYDLAIDARYGESFFEELREEEITARPVKFTLPLKRELVFNLSAKLDERSIRGPYIPELVEELEAFSYHMTHSGNIVYEAPSGFHDDTVSALMLAASMLRRKATDWVVLRGKSYLG